MKIHLGRNDTKWREAWSGALQISSQGPGTGNNGTYNLDRIGRKAKPHFEQQLWMNVTRDLLIICSELTQGSVNGDLF